MCIIASVLTILPVLYIVQSGKEHKLTADTLDPTLYLYWAYLGVPLLHLIQLMDI